MVKEFSHFGKATTDLSMEQIVCLLRRNLLVSGSHFLLDRDSPFSCSVATITFRALFPIPCRLNISASLIVDSCSSVVMPVLRIALWAGLANFFSRLSIFIRMIVPVQLGACTRQRPEGF